MRVEIITDMLLGSKRRTWEKAEDTSKSGGRSFFVVETANVDGTDTTYTYDITSGTAELTGSVNGGVYAGMVNEVGQSVVLQSSEPDKEIH